MSTRYWSQDEIDEINNARGCQVPFWRIAEYYGCSVEDLQALLGIPQFKQAPAADGCDLWRADELREVL